MDVREIGCDDGIIPRSCQMVDFILISLRKFIKKYGTEETVLLNCT